MYNKKYLRHLLSEHPDVPLLAPTTPLYGCKLCSVLTTSLEQHGITHHPQTVEASGQEEKVQVRLVLLPSKLVLVDEFLKTACIAEVLLAWAEQIKAHMRRGEDEEGLVRCAERRLTAEVFDTTMRELGGEVGQEITLTYEFIEAEDDLTEEDRITRECQDRLLVNEADRQLAMSVEQASEMLNRDRPWTPRPIVEEMLAALDREDSPFHSRQFPPTVNKNNYCTILEFSSVHMRKIYLLILSLYPTSHQFSKEDVFPICQVLSEMSFMVNKTNTAMKKVKTLLMKTSGLTNDGLESTQKAGISVGASTWRRMRSSLADMADGLLSKAAKIAMPMISFDNLNFNLRFLRQDFTQAIWLFKKVDTEGLPHDDAKTSEEKLDSFKIDAFLLTSPQNEVYMKQFKIVMYSRMAQTMAEEVEGCKFLKKMFPKHHAQKNKAASKEKTTAHMEKPLYVPENNTLDMVSILLYLQDRWLEILTDRVQDGDMFREALRTIRDPVSTIEERQEAEQLVLARTREHGELVIFGDQLTVDMILTAKDAQKGSLTILERLDIISVTSTGLFHMDMNMIIQDYMACMEADRTLKDELSMAWFKLKLDKTWIRNMENVIKASGKFEEHRRFVEGIGREFLVEAMRKTLRDMDEDGQRLERGKEDMIVFFDKVLKDNNIHPYFDPEQNDPDGLDDLASYASNMASRFLLADIHRQAEREADCDALTAIRINMTAFFYNASGNRSKYSQTLMFNLVDYHGASSATRRRMDILVCANLSGKMGANAHIDKVNEWFVQEAKEVSKSQFSLERVLNSNSLKPVVRPSVRLSVCQIHLLGPKGPSALCRS